MTGLGNLYRGDLFRKAIAWARCNDYDEVAILSARHGLVPLHQLLQPYDNSLKAATMQERRHWAARVLSSLQERGQVCAVTFLAGRRYTEPLVEQLRATAPRIEVHLPLAGLGISHQKAWLVQHMRGGTSGPRPLGTVVNLPTIPRPAKETT